MQEATVHPGTATFGKATSWKNMHENFVQQVRGFLHAENPRSPPPERAFEVAPEPRIERRAGLVRQALPAARILVAMR